MDSLVLDFSRISIPQGRLKIEASCGLPQIEDLRFMVQCSGGSWYLNLNFLFKGFEESPVNIIFGHDAIQGQCFPKDLGVSGATLLAAFEHSGSNGGAIDMILEQMLAPEAQVFVSKVHEHRLRIRVEVPGYEWMKLVRRDKFPSINP